MPDVTTFMSRVGRFVVRLGVFTVVWWIISEGDSASLWVGVPVAAAATAMSVALRPGRLSTVRVRGAAGYALFFFVQSVIGGVDVALRALRPSMPLDPACVTYRLRLADTAPRVLLADTLSLLPGTLSAHLDEDALVVHVLDRGGPVIRDIGRVESRVADVFGIELPPSAEGTA